MLEAQRETCLAVVEAGLLPRRLGVAIGALDPKRSLVLVVLAVAVIAGPWSVAELLARGVAGRALDARVRPGEQDVDWRALARVGGTIAILMGVAHRREIAAELQAGGLAPATPVAVIESATTGREVVSRCTLDALGDAAVASPAVIVVGAVAAFDVTGRRGHGDRSVAGCESPFGDGRMSAGIAVAGALGVPGAGG